MIIRKAQPEETDRLMDIYAKARAFMAEHGNPGQWGTSYPQRAMIEEDIRQGFSYVCELDGKVTAVFFYRQGEDLDYQVIYEGNWLDDASYGVVHRIASDGTVKGTASFCLNWALEQCGNLRIDTHRDNAVMLNMLKKNGFTYCGIICLQDGTERLAFQKRGRNPLCEI